MNLSRTVSASFLLLVLAAAVSSSAASAAGIARIDDPRFTAERNAATTLVATVAFYVDRMAARCGALAGTDPEAFAKQVSAGWQASNARFFQASVQYQGELVSKVEATGDAQALDALTGSIRTAVQGNGQAMVDQQLSGTGEQRQGACKAFVASLKAGALNLGPNAQFYKTLDALANEQAAAAKPH